MFLVGVELDFGLLKRQLKTTVAISAVGIVLPFGLSVAVSWALYNGLENASKGSFVQFTLFLGVAMSITAFPVLARIIKEKHLLHTRLGITTMSTAAWDDVVAWCILPFVLSIITGSDYLNALWTVISLIVFVLLMFFVGRRFFGWLFHRFAPTSVSPPVFGVVIIFVMMASWVTDYIGLHSIFGAFIFGVILPREGPFLVQIAEKLEDVVLALFLPIYFITSGLKTDIGSLTDGKAWGFVVLVTVVAAGSKIIGCGITARICGMTAREALTLGVMMNSKGLVELIVLNIGYDYGIISRQVFTIMVIMALVTTFITAPLVHWLYPLKRVLEFETQVAGKQSLVFLVKDRRDVASTTTLLNLLARAQPKKWKLHALHMKTLDERPSAYMATNHPDEVLEFAEASARLLNVKLKPTSVVYDDTRESRKLHIVAAATKNNAHFLIMKWNLLPSEDSSILGGVTVQDISPLVSCNLAVMIDRGLTHAVQHVTFVYNGGVSDLIALKLVRAMARSKLVKLKVIIPELKDAAPKEIGQGAAPLPTADEIPIQNLKAMNERDVEICIVTAKQANITRKIIAEVAGGEGQLLVLGAPHGHSWTHHHPQTNVIVHDIAMATAQTVLIVTKSSGSGNLPSQSDVVNLEPSSPLLDEGAHAKKKTMRKGKKGKSGGEVVASPKESDVSIE
eukprot:TRINITY_DN657_c0_g1_i2.p1 TRINITY_DN657_c0_g1~~TRINITY_DN657_c0_g1_i2.p1  ORF type:complete len:679 (+),score=133.92 TRINITY_DN657_c0_g1_i2:535-2571(+)